jgi:hypothetical protein
VVCRQLAAAVMMAACCLMDGDLRERNQLPPRQQAGRTYSGSKLRAVHGRPHLTELPPRMGRRYSAGR